MHNWTPEHLQEHLDNGEAVFLKLWKPGCGACKLSIPALERLEPQHEDLVFGQIDVDAHPEMLEIASSEVLPEFFVFRSQKLQGRLVGFKGLKKLEEFVTTTQSTP